MTLHIVESQSYRVICEIKALCCDTVFHEGDELKIIYMLTPNRMMVYKVATEGLHKVKRSTFRRCTIPLGR